MYGGRCVKILPSFLDALFQWEGGGGGGGLPDGGVTFMHLFPPSGEPAVTWRAPRNLQ